MTSVTDHKSLETMWLMNTGIGVEDCLALSELLSSSTSLKKLIIGKYDDDLSDNSSSNSDDDGDDISCNHLPPEAVELIFNGLGDNTTLELLWMTNAQISDLGTVLLASVLSTNDTLVHLNLAYCNIVSEGACKLASDLHTNNTLQKLNLEGNPIGFK